jgi:hypothetical protein
LLNNFMSRGDNYWDVSFIQLLHIFLSLKRFDIWSQFCLLLLQPDRFQCLEFRDDFADKQFHGIANMLVLISSTQLYKCNLIDAGVDQILSGV